MTQDREWTAVYEVVKRALLDDRELHKHPPQDAEEVGHVAETVADHLVASFRVERRE